MLIRYMRNPMEETDKNRPVKLRTHKIRAKTHLDGLIASIAHKNVTAHCGLVEKESADADDSDNLHNALPHLGEKIDEEKEHEKPKNPPRTKIKTKDHAPLNDPDHPRIPIPKVDRHDHDPVPKKTGKRSEKTRKKHGKPDHTTTFESYKDGVTYPYGAIGCPNVPTADLGAKYKGLEAHNRPEREHGPIMPIKTRDKE